MKREPLRTNEKRAFGEFQLKNDVRKLEERLRATQCLVEQKDMEMKKMEDEKEDALAAQEAAEEALRRVYTHQHEDDDSLQLESVIAPLEAEIKFLGFLCVFGITLCCFLLIYALQEDNKALERLTKSKESALLEAEGILKSALERALIIEEVQNHNFELRRQIEICQMEQRISLMDIQVLQFPWVFYIVEILLLLMW